MMKPEIKNISELEQQYKFTLSNIDVSLANAIRRTIISDIPINCVYTENYSDNDCKININTTRLHNELLKHRLSSIPVHMKDLKALPGNYILELHEKNETDQTIYVTTEHFKIKNKENGQYLNREKVQEIFPPDEITNCYIDFVRLRPPFSNIPGEEIELTADFSLHTSGENGCFNVVSKCSYGNTIDTVKVNSIWSEKEATLKSQELISKDIEFEKKNFYLLDAQRHFKENSFDFVIQTLGIYSNTELVKNACTIIVNNLVEFTKNLNSDLIAILPGQSTMSNCYDIKIDDEYFTLGKIIEYYLHQKFYDKVLNYIGFKKIHPHDSESILRIAFKESANKQLVVTNIGICCAEAVSLVKQIGSLF